ncbi:Na/Pi cotransporter family protein [Patescibacteria group bacterium]|nr:Na/Pi cotransporter family protein [Patescibacteria group bacterium]
MIIGANIGSTALGLVLGSALGAALKLSTFALPMLAVGGIGELFLKKKRTIYLITRFILALGLVLYGIGILNDAVSVYAYSIDLTIFDNMGIMGYFLIGVLLTALMHSSDAMLILALTFLAQGVIGFPEAIAIVIGANLGTTISAIEASASGSAEQKQIALSHFLFNLICAVAALPLLYPSVRMMGWLFDLPKHNLMALVVYDVIYNVVGAILFYPFMHKFVLLLKRLVRQKESDFVLHSAHVTTVHVEKVISALTEDVIMLLKKVYEYNAKNLGIDTAALLDSHNSLETKYAATVRIHNDNLEQEYKVISTIEENLMQSIIRLVQKHKDAASHYRTTLFLLREAIERIVYSAKTLNDSKESIDELHDVKMSLIDQYLRQFKEEMVILYIKINTYLTGKDTPEVRKHIQKYFNQLTNADEHFLNLIGEKLPQEALSNRQVSILLHVSQALNRSHKAMLHTIDILYPEKR